MYNVKHKKNCGFILIYTVIIASLCAAAALACFNMQVMKRDGNIKSYGLLHKQDYVQRDREYLLTDLDNFIDLNFIDSGSTEGMVFFANLNDFQIVFGNSTLEYYDTKDSFYICYYIDGKFFMEELCRYVFTNEGIELFISEFSYRKGELLE
ncbi:MAG: hypothetical protein AB9844_10770 [Clostridiaceae bacterium]